VENYPSSTSSVVAFIPCRGNVLTEPLPSNKSEINFTEPFLATIGGIHIQTHRLMGRIMKYAVDMGTVAMTWNILDLIKIGAGI
jgi:hypothetical protein